MTLGLLSGWAWLHETTSATALSFVLAWITCAVCVLFLECYLTDDGLQPGSSSPESRSKINLLPTMVDCIMTQHKSSCPAPVLVSLCIAFMLGKTKGCSGELAGTLCVKYYIFAHQHLSNSLHSWSLTHGQGTQRTAQRHPDHALPFCMEDNLALVQREAHDTHVYT